MTINYPNGRTPSNHGTKPLKNQVQASQKLSHSNRGMSFEDMINSSNHYYRERKIALVHKKPTPIKIVKVNYPSRRAATITEAYFSEASTTDYNGVYQGHYLDFEAKETKNKTSFPLNNFHDHQMEHMRQCLNHNGVPFVLIWFSTLRRCFLLSAESLLVYWDNKDEQRKSIPLAEFEKNAVELKIGISPAVPYIESLTTYLLKEN